MEPVEAGRLLRDAIRAPEKPLTIADAAAQSGLALRDAERGLHWLVSEYRGHLRVTEDGDLLFLFPHRFAKPWETRDRITRALDSVGRGALGVARFVVRAWLSIVLLGYVAIFAAALIAITFGRSNDDSGRGGGVGRTLGYVLLRLVADALFWTFHPFSPVNAYAYGYGGWIGSDVRAPARRRDETPKVPFYEKVNRFFFGPTMPRPDPREAERAILAQIRAGKGRIGLADVMRVTGLPRDQADPMMARLMVDYDGDVDVSEDGGIVYRFEAIRKTATDEPAPAPPPAWSRPRSLPLFTGNSVGTNVLIFALNGFNLLMSLVALDANLTLHRLSLMFQATRHSPPIPLEGTPMALGVVPLVFSLAVLVVPIARAIARPIQARRVARENGRLALMRELLSRVQSKTPVTEEALSAAYAQGAGHPIPPAALTKEIVALGGDADIQPTGAIRYRFVDLETEAAALEEERAAAADEEARVGKVVFASDQ